METPVPESPSAHAPAQPPETGPDQATRDHLWRLGTILIGLSILWRLVRYAVAMPVWGDEAFLACNFVMRDFAGMLEPLVYGQIAPLGFMWANLAATELLGLSEWGLRLVPTLAGIASLLMFAWFARNVLTREAALMAVGIFAASYFILRHTVEIKPYSFDLLCSIALTSAAWSVISRPDRVSRWVVLIVLGVVSPWCSYPSVFVGGGIGLVLTYALLTRRLGTTGAIGWLIFGVTLCCSAAAMYLLYARPHVQAVQDSALFHDPTSWSRTFPELTKPWTLPAWFYQEHLGTMFSYPHGGRAPRSAATFILFCIGIVWLWRRQRLLVLLMLSPFLVNFIAAAMHKYPYGGSQRVVQHLAPAVCLLAGAGLAAVLERFYSGAKLRSALTVASVFLAAICVGGIIRDIAKPQKSDRVRRRHEAVRGLVERTEPGDKWIVFNALERVPYAPFFGDWRGRGAIFLFNVQRWLQNDLEFATPPEALARRSGQTVWLVCVYADEEKEIDFPDEQWADYLSAAKARLGGEPEYDQLMIKRTFDGAGNPVVLESLEVYRFDPP